MRSSHRARDAGGAQPQSATIRLTAAAWETLQRQHRNDDRVEHLSVAFARVVETAQSRLLLIDDGDIITFDHDNGAQMRALGVALGAAELRRLMWAFAQSGRRGFVTLHDHWFSERDTRFSGQDDRDNLQQDRYLRECFEPALRDHPEWGAQRDVVHASIVFDRTSVDARIIDTRCLRPFAPVRVLTTATERWLRLRPNSVPQQSQTNGMHARHRDFLSDDCLATIAGLRIGIVGCGGLGPMLAENLARLGVGELVLVDHDALEASNLNRWLAGSGADVGRAKADLLAKRIEQTLPEVRCRTVIANVLDGSASEALIDCDAIFGAVDSDAARHFLNHLSVQYLVPLFDVAVKVRTRPSMDFLSRFVPVLPGYGSCLECAGGGLLDAERIESELNPFLATLKAQAGYTDDDTVTAPSVMALNMRSAADAILEFIGYLNGWNRLQGAEHKAAGTQTMLARWRTGLRVGTDMHGARPASDCFCSSDLAIGDERLLPRRKSIADAQAIFDALAARTIAASADTTVP